MASNPAAMAPQTRTTSKPRSRFEIRDNTWRWIFLLPAVIVVVALLAIPVLWTLYAAFTDLHMFRQGVPTSFVGFRNFEKLLANKSFWRTAQNTLVFTLGVVPTQLVIGMVVALCLNNITRGRKFFRTWFLMPLMVSPVVVAFVVGRMLFAEDIGPINDVIRWLGFKGIPWFTHPVWAMVTLIAIDVWQWSSFMILMLMAGLQGIPPDLHEAARVDGATGWQSFWKITFPLMLPVSLTAVVLRIIFELKLADIVINVTAGGPGGATDTVSSFIYREYRDRSNVGYGTMLAMFYLVVIIIFVTMLLNFASRYLQRSS